MCGLSIPQGTLDDVWRQLWLSQLGVLLAFGGWGPGMLLKPHSAQDYLPQHELLGPEVSVVPSG